MSITLRTLSMTENLVNSVERVAEYTHLDREGKGPGEGGQTGTVLAPDDWPALVSRLIGWTVVALNCAPILPIHPAHLCIAYLSGEVETGAEVRTEQRGRGGNCQTGCAPSTRSLACV